MFVLLVRALQIPREISCIRQRGSCWTKSADVPDYPNMDHRLKQATVRVVLWVMNDWRDGLKQTEASWATAGDGGSKTSFPIDWIKICGTKAPSAALCLFKL